jgi:HK97 family phage major capsid protein
MRYHDKLAANLVALSKHLMIARGRPSEALSIAQSNRAIPVICDVLKSAIQAGSTTGTWGEQLAPYRSMANDFAASLAPFGCFDALLQDQAFKNVPLRTSIAVTSMTATATSLGERQTKPISKLELHQSQLVERKAGAVVVVTDELVRNSAGGASLFGIELRRAVARASDEIFLDQMLNDTGITSVSSSGMSAAQFASDLAGALDNLQFGADGRIYMVVPPATAKVIALMRDANGRMFPGMTIKGGEIAGIQVLVSDAASSLLLFDAGQVAAASDVIQLNASDTAMLQLSDSPTSGVAEQTSLWQSGKRALRAERTIGVELLRVDAAVEITGVTA